MEWLPPPNPNPKLQLPLSPCLILLPKDGPRLELLPCLLTIEISLPGFTVADLSMLSQASIIASRWTVGQDIPLRINDELIAWSEFEIVQNRLAVRLTELA